MTLGRKIYLLRSKRNISQESLADELSVSRQSISKWETDQSVPELDKIQLLCKYFNVSIDYLLGDYDVFENDVSSYSNKNSANKLKRVAKILLKTSAILSIVHLILFLILVLGQRALWYVYYRNIEFSFVFPYIKLISLSLFTVYIIIFAMQIFKKIGADEKTIIWEIIGISFYVILIPIINEVSSFFEGLIYKDNIAEVSNYLFLNNIISRKLFYFYIPSLLFLIGMIISLTSRKIDYRKYEIPKVEENELVGLGFKFLSFFMGFLGGIIIWVFSFILLSEWKYDKPVRYKNFKKLFIVGLVLGVLVKLIILYFHLLFKVLV